MKSGQIKALSALILSAVCGTAGAAGFQLLEQNASGIGNAFAGSAADAQNASIIYNNPAGMTELQDHEFSIGAVGIKPSFTFNYSGSSGVSGAGTGGDAGHWGVVPDAYLAWKLTDRFSLGLGVSAPFGLLTNYASPWTGSAQSNKFSITTYNINPAIAYKVNDAVSLGVGVNYQHFDADYQRQLSTLSQVPFPSLAAVLGGTGFLMPGNTPVEAKLSGDAWGWNAGALFKLSPSTKLGLSYRSQMNYNLTGTLTASGSSAQTNSELSGNIRASVTLPDTAIASITHQLNDHWELLGDVQWTGWGKLSSINLNYTSGALAGQTAQTLNTSFRNTWRIAVGANYKINDAWKIKTGLAWDQSPVRGADTRLASLPDNDRYWVSAGVQYKPTKLSAVDFGVAYLFMHSAAINNNQSASGLGTLSGSYNDSGLVVGLQYSQAF